MNSVLDRLLGYLEPARALVEFPLRFVLNLLDFHLPAWGYLVYDLGVVIFFYFVLRSLIQRFRLALPRGGQPLPEYDARGLAPEPDDEDIYLLDARTLKLCLAENGKTRPSKFSVKDADETVLCVFERISPP